MILICKLIALFLQPSLESTPFRPGCWFTLFKRRLGPKQQTVVFRAQLGDQCHSQDNLNPWFNTFLRLGGFGSILDYPTLGQDAQLRLPHHGLPFLADWSPWSIQGAAKVLDNHEEDFPSVQLFLSLVFFNF